MPAPIDITGERYGRLLVIGPFKTEGKRRRWLCRCDCGTECFIALYHLRGGRTVSCGCRLREIQTSGQATHGHARGGSLTTTYRCWTAIQQRCHNLNNVGYADYGGRGIRMCDRWRNSFQAFLADMGAKPAGHQIDRIDSDGNYEPDNCRWVTPRVNNRNRRSVRWIEFEGRTQTLTDWAAELGISAGALFQRLASPSWSLERALTTPGKLAA